ncbi:response regulator [Dactylosporangium matsuzakiense]|uniref:DNA-binding response regulator n=1 Tax=Dactylosporangium matsuzakiense TaxID=53360 RepID=A0A9W6KET4_9ACTN|nr:response regulator transcription factor [Dactylosporangium matsuzakiense]UWZ46073.1 response regulator transcription factor [Dactylosporangium matsuzakiense]GLL00203.1 DNA-binding response regulator [Dactylosporangium matsuzakiense]
MSGRIRVVVVDDEALIRGGLRLLIAREADLELVGEAADGEAALELIRAVQPDVALVDLRMPGLDGLGVLRELARSTAGAGTRVVVVTTFEDDENVFAALRAGAAGFLLKDAEPAELIRAIRVVAGGEALLSPSVTRRVIGRLHGARAEPDDARMELLTEREREVAAWVATGRSNEEIAAELACSPATVRTHVGRAMLKVSARDRAQLAVMAIRAGLTIP